MSTETEVSTGEETLNQAPEVVDTPEVTTPEVEAETEAAAPEAETPEEDSTDKALKRMERRIAKRTADVYRARSENEQLKARLAELESTSVKEEKPQSGDPVVLAREIVKAERFAEKANALVNEGKAKHADYMDALKDLAGEVGEFVKRDGTPSPFMDVVLEVAEKPTALLYHLGKNPDIAADLAELSPIQLAKRLDRIERELNDKQTPKPSTAPKPLEPLKPKSTNSSLPSDDDPVDVWIQKERKRVAALARSS